MNVLSRQVTSELFEIFSNLASDSEIVAIILTGAGERAFMAGADIKEFPVDGRKEKKTDDRTVQEVFNFIESIGKPVIAVLNGYTLGGGLELALTCDFRIAEEHAVIGLPEVKLGLLPGGGGTQRLPRIVGPKKAKEIMFTGEPVSADEAMKVGIVSEVVAPNKGLSAAYKLAEKFTGHSLQSLRRIKMFVNKVSELSLEAG